jgi:hypothetical protein
MPETTTTVITPADVEHRLRKLGVELDDAFTSMRDAEHAFFTAKATYEVSVAEARMRVEGTVQLREDTATLATADKRHALAIAEASVRAARGNVDRIRTQIDIARSVGTLVRGAMSL